MSSSKTQRRAKLRRRAKRRRATSAQSVTVADISTALELQRGGQLAKAKALYCEILDRDPANADAWHLLGMTLFAGKEPAEALNCLQHANAIVPNHPDVLANMGVVLREVGQMDRAIECLRTAIAVNPNCLAARNNLGTVLLEQANLEAAEEQFRIVLENDPSFDNAAMNLANVWQQTGRLQKAESLYRKLLDRAPDNGLCLNNLGETLRRQGKFAEAADKLTDAVQIAPDSLEVNINLNRVLVSLGQHDEACRRLSELAAQHPDQAKPHHYLGRSQAKARDFETAVATLKHAITLDPNDAHIRSSLGFVYLTLGQKDQAANCFRDALDNLPSMWQAHSALLFVLSGDPDVSQQQLFDEHRKWGATHGSVAPIVDCTPRPRTDQPLRVGYVSPDFRDHAVAKFILPVLEHHSQKVETYCYAEVPTPDEVTARVQSVADHWRFTNGQSDLEVARMIVADEIDVLVDLAGHTAGNRLKTFAYRPAPVQVTWLGYPNTTGLGAMDFRLTCETQNPTNEPSYHTEELVRLPCGSICFAPPTHAPEITSLPMSRKGYVTFGSLHRPFKVTPEVRETWAEVLHSIPNSRLILFNTAFNDAAHKAFSEHFVSLGIETERFEIRGQYDSDSYLEVYKEIDIGLDTTPWAGGTTTLEALWMGVPVVGFYGQRRSARSTAAILTQVGLADLVGKTAPEYVQRATNLAVNLDRLKALRESLRDRLGQTICNAQHFTEQLELAFQSMTGRV